MRVRVGRLQSGSYFWMWIEGPEMPLDTEQEFDLVAATEPKSTSKPVATTPAQKDLFV